MKICKDKCDLSESTARMIREEMKKVQENNIHLALNKTDNVVYSRFKDKLSEQMNSIQDGYDKNQSLIKQLENWIDIY